MINNYYLCGKIMQASELMATDIPVLRPDDRVRKAVDTFLDTCLCHLPIVNSEGILEGLFPVEMVMHRAGENNLLSDFHDDWIQAFIYPEQHGIMVFEIIARLELSLVPVVNEQHQYLGSILTSELLVRLGNLYSFKEPGGIIHLTLGIHDYNLTEIARIVESNNAKILILYTDMDTEQGSMKITLKINTTDLTHIIPTFERFNYTVDYFFPNGPQSNEMKERYDMLMKLFDL